MPGGRKLIVILTLVVIIGWNKGVGDWMESRAETGCP